MDINTYMVNTNAGKVWYGMKELGDDTKGRLQRVSRYIRNSGATLTEAEVLQFKAEVDKLSMHFVNELTNLKSQIDSCFGE